MFENIQSSIELVFLIKSPVGGAWRRQVEFLRYLQKQKINHHLLVYEGESVKKLKGNKYTEVHPIKIPIWGRGTLNFFIFSLFKLIKLLSNCANKRVLVTSFEGSAGLSSSFLKKMIGDQIILNTFLRGSEYEKMIYDIGFQNYFGRKGKAFLHKKMISFLLSNSDQLIVQSKNGLADLKRLYCDSIPEKKSILNNNLNAHWIKERLSSIKKSNYEAEEDVKFRVCFVGRINIHVKGIDNLLLALKKTNASDIHLDLVGSGNDESKLLDLIDELGVQDKVTYHGFLENPMKIMSVADLIVVPSRSDPMPNVVLEAFALKKVVIGARVDGIPVMLKYDELLFDMEDVDRIKELILKAKNDDVFYSHLQTLIEKRSEYYNFNWGKKLFLIINEPIENSLASFKLSDN